MSFSHFLNKIISDFNNKMSLFTKISLLIIDSKKLRAKSLREVTRFCIFISPKKIQNFMNQQNGINYLFLLVLSLTLFQLYSHESYMRGQIQF
jgi:hypothetical protein